MKQSIDIEGALSFKNFSRKKNEPEMTQKDLAEKIFTNVNESSRIVNMSKLNTGKVKRVDPDVVRTICNETGVDANFLFKVSPMDSKKLKEYGEVNG